MAKKLTATSKPFDKDGLMSMIKFYREIIGNSDESNILSEYGGAWALLETTYMMYESQEQLNNLTMDLIRSQKDLTKINKRIKRIE